MKRTMRSGAAVVATLALVVLGTNTATAAAPIVSDGADVSVIQLDESGRMPTEGGVVYGGTTQSTDPTRYDYVAPPSEDGGLIQPMSAIGYQNIGGFTFSYGGVNIGVPGFVMQHGLNATGLKATQEYANYSFGVQVQLCNFQTQFQNRSGSTIYATRSAPTHTGCIVGFSTGQALNYAFTMKTGNECARLFVSGSYKGEQCHAVFP